MGTRTGLLAVSFVALALPAGAQRFIVDATRVLRPVSRDVYGANLEYTSADVAAVRTVAAQFTVLRFPGGDADSGFLWEAPDAGDCGQRYTWSSLAGFAARRGLGLFMETNILRSTPADAAEWVADARRRGLRVPVVAVGNEVWGDFDSGYRSAERYAADVVEHARAIRERAPGTRIAAAFGTFNEDDWNREVVRRAGHVIDAVDLHWYPHHREYERAVPAEIMAEPEAIPALLARVRGILRDEAPQRADRIAVIVGEYDCAEDPPRDATELVAGRAYSQWGMPNAVCYGAALGEMLLGGVEEAHMYAVQGYRFGAIQGSACNPGEPRVVRPKALAHQIWREHFGDQLLAVQASGVPTYESEGPIYWDGFAGTAPYLKGYASLADQGRSLRMIVVSRQERAASRLTVELRGFAPQAEVRVWEISGSGVRATNENVAGPPDAVRIVERTITVAGSTFTLTVPPHSVAAYSLRRQGAPPEVVDAGAPIVEVDVDAGGPVDAEVAAGGVDASVDVDASAEVDAVLAPADGATAPALALKGKGCAVGPAPTGGGARWAWLLAAGLGAR